mmetsp:Transcript_40606/g.107343  ORF Transcript_40606/g.107343 Transcript_40606/m.107343 type:complete len:119 (+) Transcript_40606:1706-2062(+)
METCTRQGAKTHRSRNHTDTIRMLRVHRSTVVAPTTGAVTRDETTAEATEPTLADETAAVAVTTMMVAVMGAATGVTWRMVAMGTRGHLWAAVAAVVGSTGEGPRRTQVAAGGREAGA